jgi:peptidoglycan/LPS O-acetylase OafA/YrhL
LLANAIFWRLGWTSPVMAVFGILTAWAASVVLAALFHRHVEEPAGRLFRVRRN